MAKSKFEKGMLSACNSMLHYIDTSSGYEVIRTDNEITYHWHEPTGVKEQARKMIIEATRLAIKAHKAKFEKCSIKKPFYLLLAKPPFSLHIDIMK